MFKVRFHLAKGLNYKKWQVTSKCGRKLYYDPEKYELEMIGCELKNNKKIAQKIFGGENKTVCSWVECEEINIKKSNGHYCLHNKIYYNPRNAPYWTDQNGYDIDNRKFPLIFSSGKQLLIK
jgi:hypothetical protein